MSLTPEEKEARQKFKDIIAKPFGNDQDAAEVIMQRISDRLGGYTHEEAVARNPMPEDQ